MSLERRRLQILVDAKDLDGICDWVDLVVQFAKTEALRLNGLERVVELEACAQGLFALLDHIDTLSDQTHPSVEEMDGPYFQAVSRTHRRRFEFGSTDGYTVEIHRPRDPDAPPWVDPVQPETIWERLDSTE
jgi:hypothetical protein